MRDLIVRTSALVRSYETAASRRKASAPADTAKSVYFPRIEIPRGGLVAIKGKSGAGKSTLLNLLAGLDEAEGLDGARAEITLRFPGAQGGSASEVDVVTGHDDIPRHRIGFIFQQGHLLTNVPVGLNIALPSLAHASELSRLGRSGITNERIEDLLTRLRLEPAATYRSRRAFQLSGGEAQRVAFARAIAHDPDLVFADEPTSSLDKDNARSLMLWLREWIEESNGERTVLWVTHDDQLASKMADSILVLKERGYDRAEAAELAPLTPLPNHEKEPKSAVAAARQAAVLVSGGGPGPAQAPAAPRKTTAEKDASVGPIARRIAFSELFASRRAMKARAGQRRLSAWLAHVRGSAGRAHHTIRVLPAMLSAYSDMRTAVMFVLSGILLFIAFGAFLVNERIQAKALADPLSCRLEVSRKVGPLQRPMPRTVVDELSRRPWVQQPGAASAVEAAHPPADCRSGPAAFGQILVINYGLGAPVDGKCQGARQAPRILVSPRNEPLFRRVNLLDVTTAPAATEPRVVGPAYEKLTDNSEADRNDIYLTNETYLRLREALGHLLPKGAPIAQVCLTERENSEAADDGFTTLTLAGVVEDLPTIGIRRYDAYVPDEVYQRTLQARAVAGDFEKAVIYFDPLQHAEVADFLAENRERPDPSRQSFHYSAEALKKIATLVANSWVARLFIVCLSGILGVIFFFYLSNWFNAYMEANAKPLSVLRSFGVPGSLLRRIIYSRAIVNLIIGLVWFGCIVLVGVAAWILSHSTAAIADTGTQIAEYVDLAILIAAAASTLGALLAVLWGVSWWTARTWVRRNRYVAMNLQ